MLLQNDISPKKMSTSFFFFLGTNPNDTTGKNKWVVISYFLLTCLIVMAGLQSLSSSKIDRHTVPDGYTLGWNRGGSNLPEESNSFRQHSEVITVEQDKFVALEQSHNSHFGGEDG